MSVRPLARFRTVLAAFGSLAVLGVLVAAANLPGGAAPQGKPNRYVGAAKCKNCHSAAETGDQHGAWMKMKHAKAFEVLASEEAKKVATEKGIADAQKDDTCLKCHVTGFGVAPELLAKGFDTKFGVQCESCHGPGETHMKARLAAAAAEGDPKAAVVPEGEISRPTPATCTACHNSESPSYKPFCYFKARAETAHLNPARQRSEEEKKRMDMVCGCGDKCPTPECAAGTCGKAK